MCPDFFPWMLFRRPPLLAQCVDLDVRLLYATIQNLVYGCGTVPQTTAENSDTPTIQCDQYVQQSVDMSTQLPSSLKCDPVQMAEVVQQEYVFVGGTWLYPRVTVTKYCSPPSAPQLLHAESKKREQRHAS